MSFYSKSKISNQDLSKPGKHTPSLVPKKEIDVLSQLIDSEEGFYRIQAGQRVHYVNIPTKIFDEDTMCRPYLLIPKLPDFPDAAWTTMRVSCGPRESSPIESAISYAPLPAVQTTWHPQHLNVLSLKRTKRHRSSVHEVLHDGCPAISKIACFGWDIPGIENETWAYSIITRYYRQHASKRAITPAFLGHITENGRVIGFALEKVHGEFASVDDLLECQEALRGIHRMGLTHGDVNRYNFVVDRSNGERIVRIIDFEHAKKLDETEARQELESLASELTEETGRGGQRVVFESEETN